MLSLDNDLYFQAICWVFYILNYLRAETMGNTEKKGQMMGYLKQRYNFVMQFTQCQGSHTKTEEEIEL